MAFGVDIDIWGNSIKQRLRSARELKGEAVSDVHRELCNGCPIAPWPYGQATSINPLLVTLGPSPGDSPDPEDDNVEYTTGRIKKPTNGKPHPGVYYRDSKGYWDKVRHLVCAMLCREGISEHDAYALFGNLNLDSGRSGDARTVEFDLRLVEWVLRTIRDGLRPRFLICLGLLVRLRENAGLRRVFERTFNGFSLSRPHASVEFPCENRRWKFREWDVVGPKGNSLKIVVWPQHPSRRPFGVSDTNNWQEACRDFVERNGHLLRP